jgi:RNA polymerase sigma-70 factor (ECF subfamily)
MAASRNDSTRAQAALEHLCRAYWYPLYAYVRRRGFSPEDAEDLTQAFFLSLLKRRSLANADEERGRFRSYLLGAVNYFLAGEWAKTKTQKRGGGRKILSLDLAAAERRLDLEPRHSDTPDKAFDREWARTLLDTVLDRLETEYAQENKAALFDALKQTLTGASDAQPYAVIAAQLEMSEGAIRVAVHRLRGRYRELLRAEIADTVDSPDKVNAELRHLFKAMAAG